MRRATLRLYAVLLLALAAVSSGVTAQKQDASPGKSAATLPERIWRDPGNMASLDLTYGAGGKAHAPDPRGTYTFISEDTLATNPKFDIVDGRGVVESQTG